METNLFRKIGINTKIKSTIIALNGLSQWNNHLGDGVNEYFDLEKFWEEKSFLLTTLGHHDFLKEKDTYHRCQWEYWNTPNEILDTAGVEYLATDIEGNLDIWI